MKTKTNRLLAGLLSIILVLSVLQISGLTVFAEETSENRQLLTQENITVQSIHGDGSTGEILDLTLEQESGVFTGKLNKMVSELPNVSNLTLADAALVTEAMDIYTSLSEQSKEAVSKENTDKLNESILKIAELRNASVAAFDEAYEKTGQYVSELLNGNETLGAEWLVIGLARDGKVVSGNYYNDVEKYVKENINSKEQLHRAKSTENSRTVLALTSLGYDVTNVGGHNLLRGISDLDYLKIQGINGLIWALIAFDSHNYEIPTVVSGTQATRENIIAEILTSQFADGGWALSGNNADPDITAMAVQALAPYCNSNEEIKKAVDKAIECLSSLQNQDGGYASWDTTNAESCAQVIVALTALGINPHTDSRFVKNGCSVLDALLVLYTDGGFRHTMDGKLNGMATEQGYYALVSYARFTENKTRLYDMRDVIVSIEENPITPDDPTNSDNNNQGEQSTNPDDNNQGEQPTNQDNNNQGEQETTPDDNNQGEQTTISDNNNQSDMSSNQNGGDNLRSPQTGDNVNVVVSLGLITLLLSGLAVIALCKNKKRNK